MPRCRCARRAAVVSGQRWLPLLFLTARVCVGAQTHLYHMFSQVGPVASIRVCRDQVRVRDRGCISLGVACLGRREPHRWSACGLVGQVTRRSLGYAYVNFHVVDHGKRCVWSRLPVLWVPPVGDACEPVRGIGSLCI